MIKRDWKESGRERRREDVMTVRMRDTEKGSKLWKEKMERDREGKDEMEKSSRTRSQRCQQGSQVYSCMPEILLKYSSDMRKASGGKLRQTFDLAVTLTMFGSILKSNQLICCLQRYLNFSHSF